MGSHSVVQAGPELELCSLGYLKLLVLLPSLYLGLQCVLPGLASVVFCCLVCGAILELRSPLPYSHAVLWFCFAVACSLPVLSRAGHHTRALHIMLPKHPLHPQASPQSTMGIAFLFHVMGTFESKSKRG